ENRAASFAREALLGLGNDLTHSWDPFGNSAERFEPTVRVPGDEMRQRRLAATRRAPEHHARDLILRDRFVQRLPRTQQLLLAQKILELRWSHAGGQRLSVQ